MKRASEYLKDIEIEDSNIYVGVSNIIRAAQEDAIREAVRECAENAEWSYVEYDYKAPEGVEVVGDSEYGYNYIDKYSILSVADKLIKEL